MVKSIEKWLVENPAELIDHMLTYEAPHVQRHREPSRKENTDTLRSQAISDRGHNVHFRWGDGPLSRPGAEPKLAPLFAAAIEEREKSGEEAVENRIVGLLNLRGTVDFLKLITFINSMESDPTNRMQYSDGSNDS